MKESSDYEANEIIVGVKRAEGTTFAVVMHADDPVVALQIMVANTIKINRKKIQLKFGDDYLDPTSCVTLYSEGIVDGSVVKLVFYM